MLGCYSSDRITVSHAFLRPPCIVFSNPALVGYITHSFFEGVEIFHRYKNACFPIGQHFAVWRNVVGNAR